MPLAHKRAGYSRLEEGRAFVEKMSVGMRREAAFIPVEELAEHSFGRLR